MDGVLSSHTGLPSPPRLPGVVLWNMKCPSGGEEAGAALSPFPAS